MFTEMTFGICLAPSSIVLVVLSYPIIPYPTGRLFRGTLSQALRARLGSVSSLRDALADISQQHLAKTCSELSWSDGAIVAWHEVPGKTPPKRAVP